ncbi:O-methyltransferase [Flavisolibacter tropicus]|uniref:Methyltransferase n=1 Tax=Flavisolibacter tropicus TaxID=1492898 RepID=A0A172TUF4_9BACT|nr:O-methyltransferase [Flavisolibacter tropicus]ANE50719.1 methyltransferase [Flavisolibacter tropicus]
MEIINPLAQEYAESFTTPDDALLQEITAFTVNTHAKSHMLSGHLQGKFLEMVSCMIRPQYILEIGTFTGYSAICLSKGLQSTGKLHTIEVREEDAAVAQNFIKRSSFSEQIKIHIGDARQIIDELYYPWDLVFIDADKVSYTEYFNRVLPKVKQGGFILADNVLFHGQVLTPEIKGKNPKAIQAFNEYIMQRTDVEKVLLPLRDGIYLIRKL